MNISEYIKSELNKGCVKIYPFLNDIENIGFYMLVHQSTRIVDTKGSYQCTLFLKEKPYSHSLRPLWDLIGDIENNNYRIKNGVLYSSICDASVMKLAECSEVPNNKKIEDIHILVDKYNDKLSLIQEEKTHTLIKSLFDEYIGTDRYSLEQVEDILRNFF